jgi:hypothetical protein
MRRSPKMVSPRTIQASAPNTTRTYGSTARSRTVISTDTRYDATTSSSRGPITSSSRNQTHRQATVRASTSKIGQGTPAEPADPYSLSDLEDDTSIMVRAQQVRKRKRSAVNQTGHGSAQRAEQQVAAKPSSKPRKQFSKPASTEALRKQSSKSEIVPLPEMARGPMSKVSKCTTCHEDIHSVKIINPWADTTSPVTAPRTANWRPFTGARRERCYASTEAATPH